MTGGRAASSRIQSIETFSRNLFYESPVVSAWGTTESVEHVYVRVRTDGPHSGLGEAVALPAYFDESPSEIMRAVRSEIEPAIRGFSPFDVEAIHSRMDEALPQHPLSKAAVDLAVHDLCGRILGVPVADLLGGRCRTRVPLVWVIGLKAVDDVLEEAEEVVGRGFGTLKVKIGADSERDLEVVRTLRERLPAGVRLRVDGDQGYTLVTATRVLKMMEELRLELIEQPVPKWNVEGMAELASLLETPIMADETIYTPEDAINLIRKRAADVFSVCVLKPKGLLGAKKIAHIAEAARVPIAVGSLFESGIGTAAGLHFAASCPNATLACELLGPLLLEGDASSAPFLASARQGYLELPPGPGLGIDLPE
jgi:L-alanine-DL-glutamate epimerase-like enolase superfamily enzyme